MELSQNNVWEFIDTGFNTGAYNMNFDLELTERCRKENKSFLRFYRWKPYAISLGYNQGKAFDDNNINLDKCKENRIDVVTRPTGGRAVLHSEELTYSVVLKSDEPVQTIHNKISMAIVNGLKLMDADNKDLQKISLTNHSPNMLELAKTGMYNLCFNTSIKHEINYIGKKLVGSAQRKFGDIVLQHGSILIGEHHKQIANYINYSDNRLIDKTIKALNEKTICLNELLNRQVDYNTTADKIKEGFEKTFSITFNQMNTEAA